MISLRGQTIEDLIKSLLEGVQPARIIIQLTFETMNSLLLIKTSVIYFFKIIAYRFSSAKKEPRESDEYCPDIMRGDVIQTKAKNV